MAIGGFYVIAKDERDTSKRCLISRSADGQYTFGFMSRARPRDQAASERLVDQLHEDAAAGKIPAVWASAQAVTSKSLVVYKGGAEKKVAPVPTDFVNANIECWDGTWRKFPVDQIKKVFRGYAFSFAFVDAGGTPRGDTVCGETKMQIIRKINDPIFQVHKELVLRFSICTPEDLAVPEPEPERILTLAEIDSAATPMSDEEFDYPQGGASVQAARYASDPVYRLAYDRREYIRKQFGLDVKRKEEQEKAEAATELAQNKLKIAQELNII